MELTRKFMELALSPEGRMAIKCVGVAACVAGAARVAWLYADAVRLVCSSDSNSYQTHQIRTMATRQHPVYDAKIKKIKLHPTR